MRNRIVSLLCMVLLCVSSVSGDEHYTGDDYRSYEMGVIHAKERNRETLWFLSGFCLGGYFNLLGVLGMYGIAKSSDFNPAVVPEEAEKPAYILGYSHETERERILAGVCGAILGSFMTYMYIYSFMESGN